jgi:hypothetical protein
MEDDQPTCPRPVESEPLQPTPAAPEKAPDPDATGDSPDEPGEPPDDPGFANLPPRPHRPGGQPVIIL